MMLIAYVIGVSLLQVSASEVSSKVIEGQEQPPQRIDIVHGVREFRGEEYFYVGSTEYLDTFLAQMLMMSCGRDKIEFVVSQKDLKNSIVYYAHPEMSSKAMSIVWRYAATMPHVQSAYKTRDYYVAKGSEILDADITLVRHISAEEKQALENSFMFQYLAKLGSKPELIRAWRMRFGAKEELSVRRCIAQFTWKQTGEEESSVVVFEFDGGSAASFCGWLPRSGCSMRIVIKQQSRSIRDRGVVSSSKSGVSSWR